MLNKIVLFILCQPTEMQVDAVRTLGSPSVDEMTLSTTTPAPFPSFWETQTNISIQEGQNAFLPCRVENLGDRSVTIYLIHYFYILL